MGEKSKPKENPRELRARWNAMVNAAYWLTEPEEKGVLMGLSDEIIAEAIDKDAYRFLTTFSGLPKDFNPDNMRDTLVDEYGYIFTILKMLSGDPAKNILVTRDRIRDISDSPGNKADALHSGWRDSE
jgi:hypothetical protein